MKKSIAFFLPLLFLILPYIGNCQTTTRLKINTTPFGIYKIDTTVVYAFTKPQTKYLIDSADLYWLLAKNDTLKSMEITNINQELEQWKDKFVNSQLTNGLLQTKIALKDGEVDALQKALDGYVKDDNKQKRTKWLYKATTVVLASTLIYIAIKK